MTTVAFDGRMLAADNQWTVTGVSVFGIKLRLHRYPNGRQVAMAEVGLSTVSTTLWVWLRQASRQEDSLEEWNLSMDLPKGESDANLPGIIVMRDPGKELEAYVANIAAPHSRIQFTRLTGQMTNGGGRQHAATALRLGYDARDAVCIASFEDIYTGLGVSFIDCWEDAWTIVTEPNFAAPKGVLPGALEWVRTVPRAASPLPPKLRPRIGRRAAP